MLLRVLSRSLVLMLVGCASQDPHTIQILCEQTPAYASRWGAESPSVVSRHDTFQVTETSFSGRLRIVGSGGDTGTTRFLDTDCVVPFPLQGQARWIQAPPPAPTKGTEFAPRQSSPDWQMGDEVEALLVSAAWVPSGQTAVVSKGYVLGFVPTASLGEQPPTAEQYTPLLRTLLSEAAFAQALALTRRAAATLPQEASFQRLLGHLVTLEGSKPPRPPKPLPRLAPLPDLFPDPALALGDVDIQADKEVVVYSMAVGLRLREAADPSSKVHATLNVNQPLELFSLEDEEWARVGFSPGHHLSMSYTGGSQGFEDDSSFMAYVARRFLGRKPVEAAQLLARGQEALKAGTAPEAIVLLHRALEAAPELALEPSNEAYVGLIQASFEGGRFENLFQSIADRQKARTAQAARIPSPPLLLLGCHGELSQAKIVDVSEGTQVWSGLSAAAEQMKTPHVCVGGVDPREPAKPEIYCLEGECTPPEGFSEAMEQYKRELKPEYERWHDRVESYFDSSPYLVFSPGDLGDSVQDKRLVFYDIDMSETPSEGGPTVVSLDAEHAHVVELQVPRSTDWKQLQVWLSLPHYLNSEFGLAVVDTEDQVREWLKQRDGLLKFSHFRSPTPVRDSRFPEPEPPFPVHRLISLPEHSSEYGYRNP